MSQTEECMKGDISSLATEMRRLINNKEMSDIKFLIGPSRKAIHAHRCILSARCEVFRAMFTDHPQKNKEGEVPFVLSDVAPEIFLAMLEFIYTHCVTLNQKIVIDVLGTAVEYGLDELRKLCVEYMVKHLSVNTACDNMQAGVTFGQDELKEKTMQYIDANTQNVFKSKSFHEMSASALVEILQSDNLNIDENEILDAVREWATVNSVVMNKPLGTVAKKVVKHIRLPLLSPDELKAVEEKNQKDPLLPVDLISFSWKCHALKSVEKDNPLTTKRKGTTARESHKGMQIL